MSSKIRVGLIGAGGIAQMAHIPGYQALANDCEIVAIADPSEAVHKAVAEKFGIQKFYTDHKTMLAECKLDAVSVTTPNSLHYQPTLDAIAAGCHVLCEKPLAIDAEQGKAMCRAAADAGKVLQVNLQTRFTGPARFLRDYIDFGHMGDIQYARAKALRRRGVPPWGVFIYKDIQGGGPLIDIGVHVLDLTLHMMGHPKPVVATGKTWDSLGKDPSIKNLWGDFDRSKFTVEDFAVGMIRFENGAVVTLESSFMANMEGDPYETQLFGTKSGAILKPTNKETPLTIYTERDQQYFEMTPVGIPQIAAPYMDSVKSFIESVRDGTPSKIPGSDALVLNAIFDALYKSSETGHEVEVNVNF